MWDFQKPSRYKIDLVDKEFHHGTQYICLDPYNICFNGTDNDNDSPVHL